MNIVVFDRDDTLSKSFGIFLESYGYHVMVSDKFQTAISLACSFKTDIFISEYLEDDPEFLNHLKTIKQDKPDLDIIILTCSKVSPKQIHDLGIPMIFEKPITPTLLLDIISKKKHKNSVQEIFQ